MYVTIVVGGRRGTGTLRLVTAVTTVKFLPKELSDSDS